MLHFENATLWSRFLFGCNYRRARQFGGNHSSQADTQLLLDLPDSRPGQHVRPWFGSRFRRFMPPRIACHAAHVAQRAAWHVASAHGTRVLVKQHQYGKNERRREPPVVKWGEYGEERQHDAKEACNSQPSDLGFRKSSLHFFRKRSTSSLPCSANGAFRSVNGLRLSPYSPPFDHGATKPSRSSPYATPLTTGSGKDREKRETSGEAAHRRTVHPSIRWRHEQRRRTCKPNRCPRRGRCTTSSRAPCRCGMPQFRTPSRQRPAHNRTRRR